VGIYWMSIIGKIRYRTLLLSYADINI
jgi:hypothetical protein